MKCIEKIRKTHTFFLKIEVKMMNNNEGLSEKHSGFDRGKHGEDNEQTQNFEGKLKKVLKTDHLRKTRDFRDWFKSRASRQGKSWDSLKPKFFKIFLSVFRD